MRLVPLFLTATLVCSAAEMKLGKPLTLKTTLSIEELTSKPEQYAGKTVQVKGKVTEVCQMAGCWMALADNSGHSIRIKVNDGEIVFPKDAPGKTAIAEGRFTRIDLTKEQAIQRAKHDAEEQGKKFDEASTKGPVSIYQIQGTGAVIVD